MSEFFAMGGYGLFVWGSYSITAIVLLANVIAAIRKDNHIKKLINSKRNSR